MLKYASPTLFLVLILCLIFPVRDQTITQWRDGSASAEIEDNILESLAFLKTMAEGYQILRHKIFNEGSAGVIIGKNGWLLSNEEFIPDPKRADRLLETNMKSIITTIKELEAKNIQVLIALLPDKSRILKQHLPAADKSIHARQRYDRLQEMFLQAEIHAPDLRPIFRQQPEAMFFQSDTHWTNLGSAYIAKSLSDIIRLQHSSLVDQVPYEKKASTFETFQGDLAKFVPETAKIPQETFESLNIQRTKDDFGLFDTENTDITLIGTSFSADTRWGFADSLRLNLQSSVDNLAEKGQGIFTPVQKLINEGYFEATPPKLLIWEIPERYLSRKQGQ